MNTVEGPWMHALLECPDCGYKCVGVFLRIRKNPELECGGCGKMVVPDMDTRSQEKRRAEIESSAYWYAFAFALIYSLLFLI